MLGGLALKWKWRERMKAANKQADRPNLVMGINVQVCGDKFCRYFDVEPRLVPIEGTRYHLTGEEAVKYCDENTIGVVAIMGSTFDGSYEPVKQINDALDALQKEKGWDIPIHVDGASGAFIAPFIRLGRDGYRRVQQTCQDVALYLSREIAKLGPFELLTEGRDLPVFAFKLKEPTNFTVFDLSERLRDRGWILPAYTFPKNLEDLAVLRVVVRDGFSHDLANMLLDDLRRHVKFFASQPGYTPTYTGGGHSHGASSHQKRVPREPSSNGQRTVKATK